MRRKRADGQFRLLGRFPHAGAQVLLWGLGNYDAATHVIDGMQFYEEYDATGTLQRKSVLDVRFSLPERDTFEAMVTEAGFRVAALYGNYDYSPGIQPVHDLDSSAIVMSVTIQPRVRISPDIV